MGQWKGCFHQNVITNQVDTKRRRITLQSLLKSKIHGSEAVEEMVGVAGFEPAASTTPR